MAGEVLEKLKRIRAFVFDIDGVLTDGSLLVLEDGTMLRTMDIKDGYAIAQAAKKQYLLCAISGSDAAGVSIRLERLGVREIVTNQVHKMLAFENFVLDHGINPEEILYMGDDLLDLPPMRKAGVAAAPADAVDEVLEEADLVTKASGGRGAAREVIFQVMKLQGRYDDLIRKG